MEAPLYSTISALRESIRSRKISPLEVVEAYLQRIVDIEPKLNPFVNLEPLRLTGLDRVIDLWWFFFGPTIAHLFRPVITGHEDQLRPMLREYLSYTEPQTPLTLDQFLAASTDRDHLRAEILRQLRDVPILLSPVSTAPAFRHDQGTWRPGAEQSY
jgi:Asp-tRNA(Asn)/Glu-tRNA(Gln) amidotransferase A subunit family amidase